MIKNKIQGTKVNYSTIGQRWLPGPAAAAVVVAADGDGDGLRQLLNCHCSENTRTRPATAREGVAVEAGADVAAGVDDELLRVEATVVVVVAGGDAEGLEPNALREYVNLYLTAMSEDIRGNRGTLDKYIGDAVMAFWGAPIPLANHAALAVKTALQMQATARKLNHDFIARGWPPLKIGIGLNTGEVRVGDMGSAVRRAYTVMGDPVNLASRLEGITKEYGAGIVVGLGTRTAAPEFLYRELDLVRVKGKNEPVPIFEPLGMAEAVDESIRAAVTAWHAALALFRSQHWEQAQSAIEKLAAAQPLDVLYPLYLKRIADYRANPPGDEWDAVTIFDVK